MHWNKKAAPGSFFYLQLSPGFNGIKSHSFYIVCSGFDMIDAVLRRSKPASIVRILHGKS
jgi:hypothetical protein